MTALPSSAPAVSGVETFLEMLAAERGAAQNTLEAYRRDLDAYAGFLAGRGGEVATAGPDDIRAFLGRLAQAGMAPRSEEHTSELQSLMRISYAVFCLKKKKPKKTYT